ncbi:Os02g0712512 [Oryza sativa Japonica Group]|uniref:Os02g0712512 protein n=1 Tax=Oryza sativa subsp. japonica TaxID=39947 RepID=A0A0P0VNW5_ORYSJ|nr:hypothetical protein EE612_013244 [Oryza sativa]BAS80576.1 Os02g0712512 [Oryza sativa Japonica Group]
MSRSNCFLLKPLDLPSQTLHVIIVYVRDPLEHQLTTIDRHRHKFPTRLSHDIDRIVIVVVSDQAFCLMGCPPVDIL